MFKEENFNFEIFIKTSLNNGVHFKNGSLAYKIVLFVFIITFIPTILIECYQLGPITAYKEMGSEMVFMTAFFSILSLSMWAMKGKVIFGFEDGNIVSHYLTEPYPLSSVNGYRIIQSSRIRMGTTILFHTDKNNPPKLKNKWPSRYNSNTGVMEFSVSNIVTTDDIPLMTERFEKLLRRQLKAVGVEPVKY